MESIVRFLVLLGCLTFSSQISTPADDYYWAGVVEFDYTDKEDLPPANYTAQAIQRYASIINSVEADPVDILVFPEYGLSSSEMASFVPDPRDRIAPCNLLHYEPVVRDMSCLARHRRKYLVVNLVEKARCPEPFDDRPCPSDELYRFNTNVVFDRHGTVIGKYRKFNLYDEGGLNITAIPEIVSFETDFGVTFGTFTCYDLIFEEPAIQMVRNGVTDFIFTSMWFSQLPFLTAVQIQQAWAYANNVNLLASGASQPDLGSTGTGIYAGRRGRIVSVMNHKAEEKLYVARVPKRDRFGLPLEQQPKIQFTPSEMDDLKLKRDAIDIYETELLPMESNSSYRKTLCQNGLCCDFALNYTVLEVEPDQDFYRYRFAVREGRRVFNGNREGLISVCAIMACSGDTLETCAVRFPNSSTVANSVLFNGLHIEGVFSGSAQMFTLPNSVDTSLLPLEVDKFEYIERVFTDDFELMKEIQFRLLEPRQDLLTFAIWGRKFVRMNSGCKANKISVLLLFVVTVFSIIRSKI
ncbi:vanin-like protein 1 [Uranotaenia lowii]|uniref:vanin-like protein 1 n=1 Tax=Uranotaenia lowii TaxID=190385 RepID=UPI00247878BE|nr:vanin-like protein 1 [Uranotaenia lowii]